MSRRTYKLKRLRDGLTIDFEASHALNLLRLDAKQTKREYELAEANYTFSENEIHRRTSKSDTKKPEVQG
ncbi:hypothetical protein F132_28 [Flavobacterium sp. phage 1/32]|nr:hypothetical protein F132_28 [Flavobacterium sp. phage 1/32]